jgi:hypothetical protein
LKQIPLEEKRDGMGTLDAVWAAGRYEFRTMGDFVGAGRVRSVFCHLRGNKPFVARRAKAEVLYVLFFVWLICSGPGKFSLDRLMATRFVP